MSVSIIILLIAALVPFLSSLKSTNLRISTCSKYHQNNRSPQFTSFSTGARLLQVRFMSTTDETEANESGSGSESETYNDVEVVTNTTATTSSNDSTTTTTNTTEPVDPKAEILKAKISALIAQENQLESAIAAERVNLLRTKDKISESGKTGYFIVQAQVAEFLVSK